ncbi:hypothetical protein GQ44DRAFT_766958 [Phaeosphaeriaceae sp. PMI808]|nr:hypothetical protein GQ44DRAFT_766958 [Phaeosphaeriaceae sp. PMI808]
MLPSAGLFLPETLHRRVEPVPNQTEADSTRLKYFHRTPGRPKHEAKEMDISTPPVTDVGSKDNNHHLPSIKTAFQFADYVLSSSKVSSESQSLALLIHRVRQDDIEAARLYLSPAVSNFLEAWPDKKSWIRAILTDVRCALNDIGTYMETFRIAGDDGGAIGLKRKFEWISGHQKRLLNKQQLLAACHQSLVAAINTMQTVELCSVTNETWQDPIYEAPVQPWVKREDAHVLRGPYSRREYRNSQKNLSLSGIQLSQAEEDSIETRSINSIPAELHGSTQKIFKTQIVGHNPLPRKFEVSSGYQHNAEHMPKTRLLAEACELRTGLQPLESHTITTHNTRASLDKNRPLGQNESSRGSNTPTTQRGTSIDTTQSLPTLKEKIIERNDSTTSTTAVVTVPQVAKRYEVNPIYIRKSPDRHRSLPSELPRLQSQSSLTQDLADWMMPPDSQSEKLGSVEWETALVSQSVSKFGVPCPTASQISFHGSQSVTVPLEEHVLGDDVSDRGYAMSILSATSSIARKPLPTPPVRQAGLGNSIPDPMEDTAWQNPTSGPSALLSSENPIAINSAARFDQTPRLSSNAIRTAHDAELSLLQQNLLHQNYVDVTKKPNISRRSVGLRLSHSEARGESSPSNGPPPSVTPKSMSAQAKRRAAHQRRMQIAFGESSS